MKPLDNDMLNNILKQDPDQTFLTNIIGSIFTKRDKLQWSQQKLAEKSGVPEPIITQIEDGNSIPSLKTVSKLAQALNARIGMIDNPEPEEDDGYAPLPSRTIEHNLPIQDKKQCEEHNRKYKEIYGDKFTPLKSTEEHLAELTDTFFDAVEKVGDEGGWYIGDGIQVKIDVTYDPEDK